jgi:8-oxo-dGTP pyrophosphatase MutT (NUDIX family)
MRLPIQVLVYPVHVGPLGTDVLLLKRVPRLGGFWQGVTGALEPGESLADAASRELFEETGFAAVRVEQVDYSCSYQVPDDYVHLYAPSVDRIDEFTFFGMIDDCSVPNLSHEHEECQWCSIDQALGLLKWADDKRALEVCQAVLQSSR